MEQEKLRTGVVVTLIRVIKNINGNGEIKKPAIPIETFTGKMLTPEDYIDQPIYTEDYATILIHYENGARGVLTVSQVSSGRKNRLFYEISGRQRVRVLAIGHKEHNDLFIRGERIVL